MATVTLDMSGIRERTAYALAADLGCASPDTLESPGARFLCSVRDETLAAVEEALADGKKPEEVITENRGFEISDSAPEVYDGPMWLEFVDLAAWQDQWYEDTEIHPTQNMTARARIALYTIARTLVFQIVNELQEQFDNADSNNDEGEDE